MMANNKIPYNKFLPVNEEYFGSNLKPTDRLILAHIESFILISKCDCYVTDEQFTYVTGAQKSAVRASLDRLESMGIIKRVTLTTSKNGQKSKIRKIYLQPNYQRGILKNNIPSEEVYCNSNEGILKTSRRYIEKQYILDQQLDQLLDRQTKKDTTGGNFSKETNNVVQYAPERFAPSHRQSIPVGNEVF